MKAKRLEEAFEEKGFRIVNPARRTSSRPTGPVKVLESQTKRIKVRYQPHRGDILITATCSRNDGPFPHEHETYSIRLGQLLRGLGLSIAKCKDAMERQRILDETKGLLDEKEEPDEEEEVAVVH